MKKIDIDEEFCCSGVVLKIIKEGNKLKPVKVRDGKFKAEFIPPTLQEVKDYFKQEGYSEEAAQRAYNHYHKGNWHDSNGKKVKNWKQKMSTNWMKDEYKIKSETPKTTGFEFFQKNNV